MGANDVAAVVTTGGTTYAAQEFTGNKRLLSAAIDNFMGRGLRSSTLNSVDDYNRMRSSPTGVDSAPKDIEEHERAYFARNSLSSIKQLSEFMSGVRGRRKALVFFSEGIDYDILDVFTNQYAGDVRDATREAIAAATRANVSVYSVDPRGLVDAAGDTMELTGVDSGADPSYRLGINGMQDELRMQHDSLRVLSDETGGFAAINSNDFTTAFNRMRDENSNYYLLGYYPANDRRDGRFRKIEVRVARPGIQVRARKGYVAPTGKPAAPAAAPAGKDKPSPLLREAMDSPLPLSGLHMTVSAAPFKGKAPNASVAVVLHADGAGLKFTERDGRFEGSLELSIVAVDRDGKIKSALRQKVDMPLRPESRAIVARRGVRVVSRVDVPPGKYQLRVSAVDGGSQLAGSVYYDLEVPDFNAGPLTMSGIVLTSTLASVGPVVGLATDDDLRQRAARAANRRPRVQRGRRTGAHRRGVRQPGVDAAQGRDRHDDPLRRRAGSVPHRRRAGEQRAAGRPGRLRLHRQGAAQGPGAGSVRAEGGGALDARQGADSEPGSADTRDAVNEERKAENAKTKRGRGHRPRPLFSAFRSSRAPRTSSPSSASALRRCRARTCSCCGPCSAASASRERSSQPRRASAAS